MALVWPGVTTGHPWEGAVLPASGVFSCSALNGGGAGGSPQQEMALQSPCPHRGDTCAPDPCILLSLGSCPEHLCPSHPWDGDHPSSETSYKYSSQPSPITQSPGSPAVATASVEQPRAPGWRGGTSCLPLPAGCPRMLEAPGVTGHPTGSPRGTGRLAALFFKLILSHPLQLHSASQGFKRTWQDRQDLNINPGGHFVKQAPMSKWPQYLECGFMEVTGQQSSCLFPPSTMGIAEMPSARVFSYPAVH